MFVAGCFSLLLVVLVCCRLFEVLSVCTGSQGVSGCFQDAAVCCGLMQVSQRSRVVLFGRFLFWSILVCLCMCLVVECFFFRDRYVFFQVVLGYLDCLGSNASFQLHRAVRSLLCCFWLFYVLVDRSGQLKSFSLFSSVSGCFTSCQRCLSSFFFFSNVLVVFCISNLLQIGWGSSGCWRMFLFVSDCLLSSDCCTFCTMFRLFKLFLIFQVVQGDYVLQIVLCCLDWFILFWDMLFVFGCLMLFQLVWWFEFFCSCSAYLSMFRLL